MPFCPECKCEYVEGVTRCSDCDEELVWELPTESPQPREMLRDEDAVTIFTAKDLVEAEVVRGILEGAGIHCAVTPEVTRWARGTTMLGGLQTIDIMVLESDAERAQEVIREAMEAGKDLRPEEDLRI